MRIVPKDRGLRELVQRDCIAPRRLLNIYDLLRLDVGVAYEPFHEFKHALDIARSDVGKDFRKVTVPFERVEQHAQRSPRF